MPAVIHQAKVNAKPSLGMAEFVTLMALMTSLAALSIDAMLPALHQIGVELGIDSVRDTHLIVSLFFIGMAFGQLYYGPLSDAKGRRYVIISGLIIFAFGTMVCIFAESLSVLLIGRMVQAFGVSGPRIAVLAVIRDQYAGAAMAKVMSFVMMVFILVPMLAPSFGQAILYLLSWRHIFTSFLFIGLLIGVWFVVRQPETLPKDKRLPFSWPQIWISSKYILTHKLVMFYTISSGLVFGGFLAYISASQTVFQHIYTTGDLFPLYFGLLAFSIGLASFVNGSLVMHLGMRKLCIWALFGWVIFSILLLILCIIYAGIPPLWQFVAVLFGAFFCIGILFGNINSMAMLPLGEMSGIGAAIIGSLSSVFSVPTAVFIGSFIEHSITPIALGFVVFGSLSLIFFWFAERPLS